MPSSFPSDWPSSPSLPLRLAAIWNLQAADQLQASERFLEPHEEKLRRKYQEGPTLAWGREVGKTLPGWFPDLRQNEIADRLGLSPGHFSRLLRGQEPWPFRILLAAAEQARLYASAPPPRPQTATGLDKLPPAPVGLTYRRHARMEAIIFTDILLRRNDFARRGQPDAILARKSLAAWQYELLDVLLSDNQEEWLFYARRYTELAPVLCNNTKLQGLVRACAQAATNRPCLPERDRERLLKLPDQISLGFAACWEICHVFNAWQEAWKVATDYVCRWEL